MIVIIIVINCIVIIIIIIFFYIFFIVIIIIIFYYFYYYYFIIVIIIIVIVIVIIVIVIVFIIIIIISLSIMCSLKWVYKSLRSCRPLCDSLLVYFYTNNTIVLFITIISLINIFLLSGFVKYACLNIN